MKIGIITFHWGANHGAVLQVYALSEYLKKHFSHNVEVIDYCPKSLQINYKNVMKSRRIKTFLVKLKEINKEKKIAEFRKKLNLSKKYYSNQELIESTLDYDILITGSDQIWNTFFLLKGEGKVTPVYFLNFGKPNVKKLSVSASFGCEVYPKECQEIAKPYLQDFHAISVRENSGKLILEQMGISSIVTADPTSLLSSSHYLNLCNDKKDESQFVSKMILRKQSKKTRKLFNDICENFKETKIVDIEKYSVEDWLTAIRDSRLVITNSFHCVMMCLKLHTPFVVLLEDGRRSGMNDRFKTVLNNFDLSNRIVNSIEDLECINNDIDFDKVDENMEIYSKSLKNFLNDNIE